MVMDLAQQYDQTLQETIGRSQRERNRAMRQAQEQGTSQLSNVPGSSWSDRGVEGYRGAGFKEVANPNVDTNTRSFLGSAFGDYTEGGKQQAGYYGSDNPYTQEGAFSLAQKGGFDYASKTLQDQFKSVGQSLPSIYGQDLANQSLQDAGTQIGAYTTKYPHYDTKYHRAGFIPGQQVQGWKYNAGRSNSFMGGNYDPFWQQGPTRITYNPETGYSEHTKSAGGTGLLGGVFKFLDPILDTVDPLHNKIQKATTGEETTEKQMPYFQKIAPMILDAFLPGVGSIVGGLDSASRLDAKGLAGNIAGYGITQGLTGTDLTGLGNTANAAATGAIKGGVSSAISGDNILRGALSGGLGGGVTSGLGGIFNTSGFTSPAGKAVGDFITGAGGNLASNLFNKNTNQGILQSALTSGLGRSLGGLYNNTQDIKDPKERTSNLGTANTLAKLMQRRVK